VGPTGPRGYGLAPPGNRNVTGRLTVDGLPSTVKTFNIRAFGWGGTLPSCSLRCDVDFSNLDFTRQLGAPQTPLFFLPLLDHSPLLNGKLELLAPGATLPYMTYTYEKFFAVTDRHEVSGDPGAPPIERVSLEFDRLQPPDMTFNATAGLPMMTNKMTVGRVFFTGISGVSATTPFNVFDVDWGVARPVSARIFDDLTLTKAIDAASRSVYAAFVEARNPTIRIELFEPRLEGPPRVNMAYVLKPATFESLRHEASGAEGDIPVEKLRFSYGCVQQETINPSSGVVIERRAWDLGSSHSVSAC
jgi:type VI protein secretion system component Hcp